MPDYKEMYLKMFRASEKALTLSSLRGRNARSSILIILYRNLKSFPYRQKIIKAQIKNKFSLVQNNYLTVYFKG